MRIVCDSCGAKYSIADEKIAGKLFKVRCKKCSNMIMVDGTTLGGEETAGGDAAAWYVVIDGAQTGPMSVEEVSEQVAAGSVDAETFAWREGMGDWKRLSEIEDFAASFGDGDGFEDEATRVVDSSVALGAATSASISALAPSVADAPAAEPEAPAPDPAPSGAGLLASTPAPAATASDFFAPSSAPAPSSGPAAADEAPEGDDGEHFTGERNESSVLFSLSDLTAKKKEKADDMPRTEGSGLIDIRVLASAPAAASDPSDIIGGGSSAPASGGNTMAMAPVVALPPRKSNTALIAVIALGSVLIIGLLAALVVLYMREPAPAPAPPVAAAPAEQPAAPAEPAAAAEPVAAVEEAAPPTPVAEGSGLADGSGAAVAAAAGSGQGAPAEVAVAAAAQQADGPGSASADEPEEEEEAEAPAEAEEREEPEEREERVARRDPTPEPQEEETEERNPDAVNRALEALRRGQDDEEEEEEEEPAAAPELTRSQVQSTIRRYRSRISRCAADGQTGTYRVRFVIQPNGNVTNVQAEDNDDVASCVVGVVRDMSFPEFGGSAQPVTYPFRF